MTGGEDRRPNFVGVDHVQLAMPAGQAAEDRAERFYVDLLGFARVPKPPVLAARGGCWFEAATVALHLGVEEPFRPARKAHPALLVDDLDPLLQRLHTSGVDVRPSEGIDERRRVHVDDPFGNRLELVETNQPSPEVFRALADTAVNPFCLISRDGVLEWVGASIEGLLGWPPEEVVRRPIDEIVSPRSLTEVVEALAVLNEVPEDYPRAGVGVPADLLRSDGTTTPVDLIGAPTSLTGLPWHIVFAQRSGYQRALDRALEAMANDADMFDVLTHLGAAIEQAIPHSEVAVCDRWRAPRFGVAAGSAVDMLLPEPDTPWARAIQTGEDVLVASPGDLPEPLAGKARARGFASCWVHPVPLASEPRAVAALVVWRPLPGLPTRFTWSAVHRTGQLFRLTLQWDRSHRALEHAATHDTLTGVANRRAFLARIDEVARAGGEHSAVLFIDLDHFKPVNDDHGHPAGDQVLVEVARRLAMAVRPGDLVARIGGDEFAVLCERLAGPEDAERVATRLLDVICQPIDVALGQPQRVVVGASIGLTDLGTEPFAASVMARADRAMREAKGLGRGRWVRHALLA